MMQRLIASAACAVVLLSATAGTNSLRGNAFDGGASLPAVPTPGVCCLQKGFVVSRGLGCMNLAGTVGGPQAWAEGLTLCAGVAAPFDLTTFSFVVVTPGIPGLVTTVRFAAWSDGGTTGGPPGARVCAGPSVPFATAGPFSVPVTGCKITTAHTAGGHFYVGLGQGGIGGMRWGFDSGGVGDDSWYVAPACNGDPHHWFPITSAGALVFRVCVDAQVPVEVEKFTWGDVKAQYRH